jgi:adenylate cyclase
MYYSAGEYQRSVEMFEKALRLEPENYIFMVNIADSYKFMPGNKKLADEYFQRAIKSASNEIQINPNIANSYQYLARSLVYFGELEKANETMKIADKLDDKSTDAIYAHLRIAVAESNADKIRKYAKGLLDSEYSVTLLLADPDFSVLKDKQFQDLFVTTK